MVLFSLFRISPAPTIYGHRASVLTERQIIANRITSHHKWSRRRRMLKLKAWVMGRRKNQPPCSALSSSTSLNLIDSPQPQASVTLGLRNLNPLSSREVS